MNSDLNRLHGGSHCSDFQGMESRDNAFSGFVLRDSDCEGGMWKHLVRALGKHESYKRQVSSDSSWELWSANLVVGETGVARVAAVESMSDILLISDG